MVDQVKGTNLADQIAAGITGGVAPSPVDGSVATDTSKSDALGGEKKTGESGVTKNARKRVAESTSPT